MSPTGYRRPWWRDWVVGGVGGTVGGALGALAVYVGHLVLGGGA